MIREFLYYKGDPIQDGKIFYDATWFIPSAMYNLIAPQMLAETSLDNHLIFSSLVALALRTASTPFIEIFDRIHREKTPLESLASMSKDTLNNVIKATLTFEATYYLAASSFYLG